jgi:hypothetical protein
VTGASHVQAAGEKIKQIASQYIHPTVAGYANKLLAHLEGEYGLAKGTLGKAVKKEAGEPAPTAPAAEPEAPTAAPEPAQPEPIEPPAYEEEDLDPEPGNAFQNLVYGMATIGKGSAAEKAAKVGNLKPGANEANQKFAMAWYNKLSGAQEKIDKSWETPAETKPKIDPFKTMNEIAYSSAPYIKKISALQEVISSPATSAEHKAHAEALQMELAENYKKSEPGGTLGKPPSAVFESAMNQQLEKLPTKQAKKDYLEALYKKPEMQPEYKELINAKFKEVNAAKETPAESDPMAEQMLKGIKNNLEILSETSKIKYLENMAAKPDLDPASKAFINQKLSEYLTTAPKTPTQMLAVQPELMPSPQSKHQQAVGKIALSHTLTPEQKVEQIKEYPTVKEYPLGYTAKFANSWIKALGGEPIPDVGFAEPPAATPAPTPTPSAGPQTWTPSPAPPKPATWKPASLNSEISSQEYAKYQKAAPTPTSDEESGIRIYTGGDYTPINNALRSGDPLPAHLMKPAKALQDYLMKASWPEDGTVVTRKVSSAYASKLQGALTKGAVFRDHGFVSTDHWSGSLTIKIHLKKGARAAAVKKWSSNKPEDEIVLARGTQFRVLDYQKGDPYIRVEALTPDDPDYIH